MVASIHLFYCVLGEQNYYTRVDMLKYDYMTHVYKNSLLKKTCIQNPYSTEHGGETTWQR